MKRATISGAAFVILIVLLALAENHRALEQNLGAGAAVLAGDRPLDRVDATGRPGLPLRPRHHR